MKRRDFLKALGIGTAAAAVGAKAVEQPIKDLVKRPVAQWDKNQPATDGLLISSDHRANFVSQRMGPEIEIDGRRFPLFELYGPAPDLIDVTSHEDNGLRRLVVPRFVDTEIVLGIETPRAGDSLAVVSMVKGADRVRRFDMDLKNTGTSWSFRGQVIAAEGFASEDDDTRKRLTVLVENQVTIGGPVLPNLDVGGFQGEVDGSMLGGKLDFELSDDGITEWE